MIGWVRPSDREAESHIMLPMAISPRWCRENANACAWRAKHSRNPFAQAAYREMVRAWFILAVAAEESVRSPPRESHTDEQRIAA
jgi:hypothetical protein